MCRWYGGKPQKIVRYSGVTSFRAGSLSRRAGDREVCALRESSRRGAETCGEMSALGSRWETGNWVVQLPFYSLFFPSVPPLLAIPFRKRVHESPWSGEGWRVDLGANRTYPSCSVTVISRLSFSSLIAGAKGYLSHACITKFVFLLLIWLM